MAAMPQSEHEQLQKMVTEVKGSPSLNKASQLSRWLPEVVEQIRNCATDPIHMALWVREATSKASVATTNDYERWFEHMAHSGKGFRRADLLLFAHVKKAVSNVHLLRQRIVTKASEFEKLGQDMTGRQAILICRHYFKESAIDRKHTDRRRLEAVKLTGDDVEGFWNTLNFTLQEIDPVNMPSDFELMDYCLTELRKSKRYEPQLMVWDQLYTDSQKTFEQL